ncbi:hypothetical protein C8Q74DRAFT_1221362 [Fomes fomentarius]|nr:hypothetical protein C8Q74DRAFT_1221362 [Fomes fomentarius]
MAVCSYCQITYTNAQSRHQRECPKFIFPIHQYPHTKQGPTTMVERDGTDRIICRCVDSEGIVCAGTFKNHRALWDHFKNFPTRTWLIPPSATAPNPSEEEGNIPAQEVPGSPMQQDLHVSCSMLNEAVSPSLSAQLGSSPRSQSSHMSVDPAPFQLNEQVAPVPELYDLDGEPLAAWGFLINRRLKALICLACQAVVLPSHIQGHLSQQHKWFKARIDMQVIDQAVATEGICEDWPAIPAATPLQFQGLSLLTGYECPVCTVIHPGFKSLQNHARQSHSVTLPSSNGRYQICDCQQLSKHPAARSWFPVHRYAPPPVTSFSPYLSTLREQLDIPNSMKPALCPIMLALTWSSGGLFHFVTEPSTVPLRASGDLFRGHQGLSDDIGYVAVRCDSTKIAWPSPGPQVAFSIL